MRPREGRKIEVVWESGAKEVVDLTPALASHRAFVRLRTDDDLFRALRVGNFRDCLEWPDGAELPAAWIEELAEAPFNNAEFRDAMDKLNMSLDGMASRLGIARRLVAEYRKDKPIPKTVALATRYLLEQRKAS
jgi:hypothetical protein